MAEKTKVKLSRTIGRVEQKMIDYHKRIGADVINLCRVEEDPDKDCPHYNPYSSWTENGMQHGGSCDYIEEVKSNLIEDIEEAKTESVTLLSDYFRCPLTDLHPSEKKNIELRKKVLEAGLANWKEKQFKANKKKWKKKRAELVKSGKIKSYKVGDEEGGFRIKELWYIVDAGNGSELYVLIDSEEEEKPSCWEDKREIISSIMEDEEHVQIKDITNELGYRKYKTPDIERIEKIARLTYQAIEEEYGTDGIRYEPNTEKGTVDFVLDMSVEEVRIYERIEGDGKNKPILEKCLRNIGGGK